MCTHWNVVDELWANLLVLFLLFTVWLIELTTGILICWPSKRRKFREVHNTNIWRKKHPRYFLYKSRATLTSTFSKWFQAFNYVSTVSQTVTILRGVFVLCLWSSCLQKTTTCFAQLQFEQVKQETHESVCGTRWSQIDAVSPFPAATILWILSFCVMRQTLGTRLRARRNASSNSAVERQYGNHSSKKKLLSRHLVGSLTSHR